VKKTTLADRVCQLCDFYGGLRAAARATGIDAAYLSRLRDGQKVEPSAETLDKLGLKKVVIYELQTPPINDRGNNMNIAGLDKAEVLAALYNASKQQGLGFLHGRGATGMTVEDARAELAQGTNFDYLHGRVMKIALDGDDLETRLYNRDNGDGAAERIIEELRSGEPVSDVKAG
jgi:hypothetical protein